MTTIPWSSPKSPPAAAGSWRTLFIIKPTASGSQVVFNSDELCWTSRGLCWPLRPRPEQTLASCTLHLPTDAIQHHPWASTARGFFLSGMEVPWASLRPTGVKDKSYTEQFKRKWVKLSESTLKILHFIWCKFNLKRKINWKNGEGGGKGSKQAKKGNV